ncbi:MAG TPA: tRNA epoxyqueuosine(34) reductase QueG, partial [Sedimentisphaerales bacterium]
ALGFDLVGITDASPVHGEQVNRLLGWLDAGYAGQMTWLHSNLEKRVHPAKLLPGAKSVVVVGLNYKTPGQKTLLRPKGYAGQAEDRGPRVASSFANAMEDGKATQGMQKTASMGRVTAFAQYDDYHPFTKKILRQLADFITSMTCPSMKFKICVDSTPLLERALGVRAGLGIIGKNRMLINPRLGPQILLGEIVTNLELDPDKPMTESCPGCGKCVAACPTGALKPDGSFDATKCISYLTIEASTDIPADLAPKIGNHLFGCGECLLACPYQQNAPPCANKEFVFHPDRANLDLNEVLNLTEDEFHARFAHSPILRPGLAHLKKIAAICLGNLSNS